MSKYTTEVRFIIESVSNTPLTPDNYEQVITNCCTSILGTKPPEMYGDAEEWISLCSKILMHYLTREIGFETVALWKIKIRSKLREILPYYKELYKTTLYEFDPLKTVDYEVVRHRAFEGTLVSAVTRQLNATSTDTAAATSKYSDTPQGGVDGLESGEYLTNAEITNTNANSNNTSAGMENGTDTKNDTDDETITTSGKEGGQSYASLIMEYRKTILNIELMIIEELQNYFMLIW